MISNSQIEFVSKLRKAVARVKTKFELSRWLNVSDSTIYKWLNGKNQKLPRRAEEIEKILNRLFQTIPEASEQQQGKPLQRLWNSMRILRQFTVNDLIVTAFVPRNTAQNFVYWLKKADYVRKENGKSSTGQPVFKLIRNTGPICPRFSGAQKILKDGNLERRPAE